MEWIAQQTNIITVDNVTSAQSVHPAKNWKRLEKYPSVSLQFQDCC